MFVKTLSAVPVTVFSKFIVAIAVVTTVSVSIISPWIDKKSQEVN